MILLVSYDPDWVGLRKTQLYEALKSTGRWMHYIRGFWLIATEEDPETWVDRITPFMAGSSCFVARLHGEYQGLFPERAWAWLARHAEYM